MNESIEEDDKACLECGTPIRGRADKKYCSDACRNAYHNKHTSDANNLMRNVNYTLRKNRHILADLNPQGKARVHRDQLSRKGFNFSYITNVYQTKSGNTYHFCYDQGYLLSDDDYFTLVVKKDYID
jgi:predicted nucleic acid-binding Zn ribbon protein